MAHVAWKEPGSVRVYVEGIGWDVYDYASKEWHRVIAAARAYGLEWDFAFVTA